MCNMSKTREYKYKAKWYKSIRERQITYDFIHVIVKKQNKRAKYKRERQTKKQTRNYREQLMVTRGQVGGRMGDTGKGIKEYTYHDE